MTTDDPMHVHIGARLAGLHAQYIEARAARLRWEQEEKSLKEAILEGLDYSPDDPKPVPMVAVDANDHPIFEVAIGTWRGPDVKWIQAHHPDVWALAERTKPTKTIKDR